MIEGVQWCCRHKDSVAEEAMIKTYGERIAPVKVQYIERSRLYIDAEQVSEQLRQEVVQKASELDAAIGAKNTAKANKNKEALLEARVAQRNSRAVYDATRAEYEASLVDMRNAETALEAISTTYGEVVFWLTLYPEEISEKMGLMEEYMDALRIHDDDDDDEDEVVMVQDPVGDINLQAFANDNQNVHRSSIQRSTKVALDYVLSKPIMKDQATMMEIKAAFDEGEWNPKPMEELDSDITRRLVAFGHSLKTVLDHVWSIIRTHEHKRELVKRLYQELNDGIGMCSNGKMCRLLTVLQGYDKHVMTDIGRDAFHSKFATLSSLPMADRASAAEAAFNEYGIPEEERQAWLEPLLEA